jgi:hypothetical protein
LKEVPVTFTGPPAIYPILAVCCVLAPVLAVCPLLAVRLRDSQFTDKGKTPAIFSLVASKTGNNGKMPVIIARIDPKTRN